MFVKADNLEKKKKCMFLCICVVMNSARYVKHENFFKIQGKTKINQLTN